jgi:hypothetical protein
MPEQWLPTVRDHTASKIRRTTIKSELNAIILLFLLEFIEGDERDR